MLETRDFLEPQLGYAPHWTKPPAAYWGIAAGIAVAGENAWGARLSHAISLGLLTLVVVLLGAALYDPATGTLAGLVYATSLLPAVGTASISADAPLALVEAGAVLCYVLALRAPPDSPAGRRWITAMWATFGLAFLVKGPPALLPILPLAVFHRRARTGPRFAPLRDLAIAAGVGLAWYLIEVARHPGLLRYFVMEEVVGRNLTGSAGRNAAWYGPLVVYVPVLLLGPGVWVVSAWRDARAWARGLENGAGRSGFRRIRDALAARGTPGSFLGLWLLLPLLVFCLSRSRLPLYLLPLYPAIAIGIARLGVRRRGGVAALRIGARTAVIGAVALVALKAAALAIDSRSDMARLHQRLREVGPADAEVWTVDWPRLYGLQFYLDGDLHRATTGSPAPWADATLSDVLAMERPGGPDLLLLTRHGEADAVAAATAGVCARRIELDPHRTVFRIPAAGCAAPGTAPAS